jgi:tetratricopeptide (TPR) repeat protein
MEARMRTWCVIVTALLLSVGGECLPAQHIKLAASLENLEKSARADSNDPAAHYNVALAYWNAKRWDDADSALHRAIRIDPEFPAPYMALAFLPYARRSSLADEENENRVPTEWKGPLEEADRAYRRAVMIDPLVELRLGDAVFSRSTAYLDVMKEMFGEWLADYQDGLDQYYTGKYQEPMTVSSAYITSSTASDTGHGSGIRSCSGTGSRVRKSTSTTTPSKTSR